MLFSILKVQVQAPLIIVIQPAENMWSSEAEQPVLQKDDKYVQRRCLADEALQIHKCTTGTIPRQTIRSWNLGGFSNVAETSFNFSLFFILFYRNKSLNQLMRLFTCNLLKNIHLMRSIANNKHIGGIGTVA